MAKHDSKSEPATTEVKPRRYTVGYIRDQRKFTPSPSITIKGKWLAKLGFTTGQTVSITTEKGCLVIRTVTNL